MPNHMVGERAVNGAGVRRGAVCGKRGPGREEVDGQSTRRKPLHSGGQLAGASWWEGPQV